MTMLHRHFSSLSLHIIAVPILHVTHTSLQPPVKLMHDIKKKVPFLAVVPKILDVMYANPFLPPPLFLKIVPLVTPKERRQFPKERENLRGGYIYSYIYSELGLVLELFLVQTSEKRIKLTTHRKKKLHQRHFAGDYCFGT